MTVTTSSKTNTQRWLDTRAQYVPQGVFTYHDLVVERAHGAAVWDVDGNRYIDFAGGIGTLNAGHTPERVVQAIAEQAEKLIHMAFPVASYPGYIELAERLATVAPGPSPKKTLLVNSGAEAVENAVKIARAATGRPAVIAFENGFHGRTLMGMSLTGKERPYKVGFGPFAPEIYHARYPYSYRCDCGDHERCLIETGEDLERCFAEPVRAEAVAATIVE